MFGLFNLIRRERRGLVGWFALALSVLALVVPRSASADSSTAHSVSVAVLSLDSDDAEEQADALSGALRSRIRASEGWSLIETSQSLGMLTAALRCPGKPVPADCEERIADQIKSPRYLFGYVTKGPQPSQVTAEVHLHQREKPDVVVRENYADNLKDQNDDTLRKIAQHMLDQIAPSVVGTIVVRKAADNGEIIIDGDKTVRLQNGVARLELSPGGHSVELAGPTPQKRNVLVVVGKETVVDFGVVVERPNVETPFPTRKFVGATFAIAGAALAVVSVTNVVAWRDDADRAEAFQNAPANSIDPKLPPGKSADDVCGSSYPDNATICKINSDSHRHGITGIVTGLGGGLLLLGGAYFLFTDDLHAGSPKMGSATKAKARLSPTLGKGAGGLVLSGSF